VDVSPSERAEALEGGDDGDALQAARKTADTITR